jgi:segregation and condensation protein B
LGIIAYRQPISKAEIEAIRGVNSQYSLRHLLMRGLIEKVPNPNDARSALYQTTTEFLQHLGLSSNKDLPDFGKLVEEIKLPETPRLAPAKPDSPDASQDGPEGLEGEKRDMLTEEHETD